MQRTRKALQELLKSAPHNGYQMVPGLTKLHPEHSASLCETSYVATTLHNSGQIRRILLCDGHHQGEAAGIVQVYSQALLGVGRLVEL